MLCNVFLWSVALAIRIIRHNPTSWFHISPTSCCSYEKISQCSVFLGQKSLCTVGEFAFWKLRCINLQSLSQVSGRWRLFRWGINCQFIWLKSTILCLLQAHHLALLLQTTGAVCFTVWHSQFSWNYHMRWEWDYGKFNSKLELTYLADNCIFSW